MWRKTQESEGFQEWDFYNTLNSGVCKSFASERKSVVDGFARLHRELVASVSSSSNNQSSSNTLSIFNNLVALSTRVRSGLDSLAKNHEKLEEQSAALVDLLKNCHTFFSKNSFIYLIFKRKMSFFSAFKFCLFQTYLCEQVDLLKMRASESVSGNTASMGFFSGSIFFFFFGLKASSKTPFFFENFKSPSLKAY